MGFNPGETTGTGEEKPRRTEINSVAIALLATDGDALNVSEAARAQTSMLPDKFTLVDLDKFHTRASFTDVDQTWRDCSERCDPSTRSTVSCIAAVD